MFRKSWKIRKNSLPLYTIVTKDKKPEIYNGPTLCGFPLNVKKVNQLWDWLTLEDVKF